MADQYPIVQVPSSGGPLKAYRNIRGWLVSAEDAYPLSRDTFTTPSTIAILGDSIMNRSGPIFQSTGASYHLGDTISSGDKIYHGYNSFFAVANMLLGWPFEIVSNAAVSGIKIQQIHERIKTFVYPYLPKYTAFLGGINNILSGDSVDSVVVPWTKRILEDLLEFTTPIVFTPFPNGNVTTAQKLELMKYVGFMRDVKRMYPGVIFGGDLFHACANPDTGAWLASGEYAAPCNLSSDDTHNNEYGAGVAATEVYNRLSPLFHKETTLSVGGTTSASTGQWDLLYDSTNGFNPRGNFVKNGKMLGTGGTVGAVATGNLATNWSVVNATNPASGAIALSKVANNGVTDRGSLQQIAITGTDNAGILSIRQEAVTRTDSGSGTTSWAVGDDVYAQCRIETDATDWGGGSGNIGTCMSLEIQGTNSGASELWRSQAFQQQSPSTVMLFRPSQTTMILRTPVVRIPSATERLFLWFYFRGLGTLRVTDIEMRKYVAL